MKKIIFVAFIVAVTLLTTSCKKTYVEPIDYIYQSDSLKQGSSGSNDLEQISFLEQIQNINWEADTIRYANGTTYTRSQASLNASDIILYHPTYDSTHASWIGELYQYNSNAQQIFDANETFKITYSNKSITINGIARKITYLAPESTYMYIQLMTGSGLATVYYKNAGYVQ